MKCQNRLFQFLSHQKKQIETYFKEARRAVRGISKYRLPPEFSSFYVNPAIWVQLSEERRNQHFKAFLQRAQSPRTFKKSNLAGRKSEMQEIGKEEQGYQNLSCSKRELLRKNQMGRTSNDANSWQVGYYKRIKL